MSDVWPEEKEERPCIEVRVFVDGRLVHEQRCESEEEASSVVERWSELEGSEFEVDDLSTRHRAGEILEPEPDGAGEDDRPVPDAARTEPPPMRG